MCWEILDSSTFQEIEEIDVKSLDRLFFAFLIILQKCNQKTKYQLACYILFQAR